MLKAFGKLYARLQTKFIWPVLFSSSKGGNLNQVLADTFNISQTTVSRLFFYFLDKFSLFHAWEYLYLAIREKI